MEVHHHTHTESPPAGRAGKKFTHYLWEFLMLFLAVFCGFLAENFREHQVEHQREKQYIRSLVQNVKTDTANISNMLIQYDRLRRECDSLLKNFSDARNFSSGWSGNFLSILRGYPDFIYTDQTMQQLKNAGGLRLIRNKPAIDSIVAYDAAVRDVLIEETVNDEYFNHLTDFANNHLSYRRITDPERIGTTVPGENQWINYDTAEMERLYNLVYKYRDEITDYIYYLTDLRRRGARLADFLTTAYNLG